MENSKYYKGWRIVINTDAHYDAYLPEDAETYNLKGLLEYCTPEIEDIPTIEEVKELINNY